MPLWYNSPKEMPIEIAKGFDYLCRHFGKSMGITQEETGEELGRAQHQAAVLQAANEMNALYPNSITRLI